MTRKGEIGMESSALGDSRGPGTFFTPYTSSNSHNTYVLDRPPSLSDPIRALEIQIPSESTHFSFGGRHEIWLFNLTLDAGLPYSRVCYFDIYRGNEITTRAHEFNFAWPLPRSLAEIRIFS
jgi:hypothetical protein